MTLSWIIWGGVQCNHKCPYAWRLEGQGQGQRKEGMMMEAEVWVVWGMSQRMQVTSRTGKKQRMGFPLGPSEGHSPAIFFRLLFLSVG